MTHTINCSSFYFS